MISVVLLSLASLAYAATSSSMRLASWNLRFDSEPDNVTVAQTLASLPTPLVQPAFLNLSGEQPWSTRRIKVAQNLLGEKIDIAGFQEALVRQVNDMQELLGSDWAHVGVGRDDGVAAGEFSPIFYKKSMFKLLSNDSFWLSNTPFEPSKFPGAGSFRIATATRFQTISTGRTFTYLNTHLDDQSDDERKLGASLLLQRVHFEAVQRPSDPVLLTGDFNSEATGDDSGAYKIITGAQPPVAINQTFAQRFPVPKNSSFNMTDTRGATDRKFVGGNFATFTGFNDPDDTEDWARIDFVFGGSNGNWKSNFYKVGTTLTDDGTLASDHRPVFNDITLS